jgi:glucose/mannose-6-phosphate isomerase
MDIIQKFIEDFPQQLEDAIRLGEALTLKHQASEIRNIIIAGLGGSGIGGSLVKSLVNRELKVPLEVIKGYDLPAYANSSTLLIASSYSGNTEETLQVVEAARQRQVKIACITSGGKLLELAKEIAFDLAPIPVTEPICPRANLGYSLVQLLYLFMEYRLIDKSYAKQLQEALSLLKNQKFSIESEAKQVAAKLENKLPIIYCDELFGALAVRFQQQINENAKHFAHVNVFPEMNHNELVGWVHPKNMLKDSVVLLLASTFNHTRNAKRMEVCLPIFNNLADGVLTLQAKGDSLVEQFIYLIHLTDWISFFLAERNKVDAFEINVINLLKNELAKVV